MVSSVIAFWSFCPCLFILVRAETSYTMSVRLQSQGRQLHSWGPATFLSYVAKTVIILPCFLLLIASTMTTATVAGHQCTQNPPSLCSSFGEGSVEEIGGLKCYVVGSPDSKKGILLASDIFGYEVPNFRKIADKVAAAGFYVVVPDYHRNDPFVSDNPKRPMEVWLKSHDPVKGFADSKPIIAAFKSKGITAIGAGGFCWGAKLVVELAKKDYVQAAVLLHPSFITVDDIRGINKPIAILGAEYAKFSPPKVLKQFKEILSSKTVDSKVKIFYGTSHGWTTIYNVTDKVAVRRVERAHRSMLKWFTKHVK